MIVDLELNDYGFFIRYYVNPMRIDYYNQKHYLRKILHLQKQRKTLEE